jgi:hypothetical protein
MAKIKFTVITLDQALSLEQVSETRALAYA